MSHLTYAVLLVSHGLYNFLDLVAKFSVMISYQKSPVPNLCCAAEFRQLY